MRRRLHRPIGIAAQQGLGRLHIGFGRECGVDVVDRRLGLDLDRRLVGGMAATPKRATHAEAALLKDGFDGARSALAQDFQPLDDWRGTAAYRRQVAANLLRRLELRLAEPQRPVEVEAL
jgi:hypothetical protein